MKIQILMVLLLFILTIGTVSASNDNRTVENSYIQLSDENSTQTFSQLSDLIENASDNSSLELDKDYFNDPTSTEGISIKKAIIIDGKNHCLDANSSSPILRIDASNVVLKNIVFKNGYKDNRENPYYLAGGPIQIGPYCENIAISNCTFINCKATHYGCTVYITNGENITITNCRFINCSNNGKSILQYDNSNNCIIKDCCFINGGRIGYYGEANNFLINNCTFINCQSPYAGNGVYIYYGENITISNSRFINCSRNGKSTIYYDFSNNCIVDNCSFINGGGIYYDGSITCHVNCCSFINCSNTAVYFPRGYIISDGGTGYYPGCGDCRVNGCTFINCSSDDNGGAIHFCDSSGKGKISDCNFINCEAKKGGAIYFYDHYEREWSYYYVTENAIVKNCNFTDCHAKYGGSIYVGGDSLYTKIRNCNFMKSSADIGGSIYWGGTGGKILDSTFTSSHAKNGGAIYSEKNTGLKIESSKFTKNTADRYGSAVYGVSPIKSTFSKNSKPEIYKTYYPSIKASNAKVTYDSRQTYTIKVYSDTGIPAEFAKVTIKINGKIFRTQKTDDRSILEFEVMQKPGTYKMTITSLGKTVTKTLTVKHLLSLKNVEVKKSAKKVTLQASLGKVNGKYLKNKQINFKFNGKTYKAKTDSNGIAKVTISKNILKKLKAGQTVTCKAIYKKDTIKKTVKVQK